MRTVADQYQDDDGTFKVFAQLHAYKSADHADGETDMRIGGVVSTDTLDQQDEVVVQDGLDFTNFLARGWFNDNHKQGTTDVLGYPTEAFRVRPGEVLPDGSTCEHNGWWAAGYLLNTKKGREVYEMTHALANTPRGLGFSIEGKILRRTKTHVKAAAVANVAITHCPVQTDSYLTALAKALTAGAAVGNPGSSPGEGFPIRTESLSGPGGKVTGTDTDDDFDLEDEDGRKAMAESLKGATAFPEDVIAAGGRVRKGEDDNPRVTTMVDEVERWADALAANARDNLDPENTTLTKAEAAIVARVWYPHMDPARRDSLIKNLTGGS